MTVEPHLTSNQISVIFLNLEREAREANSHGKIFDFLKEHNIPYDTCDECDYDKSTVKLLIAGGSFLKKDHILKVLKKLGIDKNRVDFILDYNELKSFRWNDLQYSWKYSDVVFGPCPHSAIGKGDFGSIISRMEKDDGWPNPIKASANGELKFTQQSLIKALEETEFYKKKLSEC